ncbi:hypothetical protein O9992_27270 [Vibrio lentus]|nr:hypothetical protein [Vibrio lentus]
MSSKAHQILLKNEALNRSQVLSHGDKSYLLLLLQPFEAEAGAIMPLCTLCEGDGRVVAHNPEEADVAKVGQFKMLRDEHY